MPITLKNVIPWGRSLDEYRAMFSLSDNDLKLRILGCADGPASFNSTLTKQNGRAVSVDPIYQFNSSEIESRFGEACSEVVKQLETNKDDYIWTTIKSIPQLIDIRTAVIQEFLADFEIGKQQKRYIAGELPLLPLESRSFDLALCSHFLFLFSDHFSYDFHLASIQELSRLAGEIRIFPLQTLAGKISTYLQPIMKELTSQGHRISIDTVDFEFQRGANQMLKIQSDGEHARQSHVPRVTVGEMGPGCFPNLFSKSSLSKRF